MKQSHKFLLLGALSTAVDYLIFSLLIYLEVNYIIAIVAGYSLGLAVNYTLARNYIFTDGTKLKSSTHELLAVVFIGITGVLLNIAIVNLLSYSLASLDPLHSRAIAIAVVFFWNFYARKWFVYH